MVFSPDGEYILRCKMPGGPMSRPYRPLFDMLNAPIPLERGRGFLLLGHPSESFSRAFLFVSTTVPRVSLTMPSLWK